MIVALLIVSLVAFAAVIRSLAFVLAPDGAGVDHWFWKAYVETYRRNRVFPPVLPQYILDEQQWYPPLFPMFLARVPHRLFDSYNHAIAIVVDLTRMLVLLAVAAWQSDGSLTVIAVAGLIYATIPIQTSYNIQLNPRGLGAIMLDLLLITLLIAMTTPGAWWAWATIVTLGGLILLTHKMTTQLLIFVIVCTAVVYARPALILLLPAWFAAAMALSRGFYWKVLVAHADIVRFWNRNWRWIGADPLRESPLYGDGKYERAAKLHKGGLRGILWHAFIMFGFNPAAWIACLLVYERLFPRSSALLIYPTPLLFWLLLPCVWAILTSLVGPLKQFGAGYLYVYNTSTMASLVLALTFQYTRAPLVSTALVTLAIALNTIGVAIYYWQFVRSPRTRVDVGLDRMLEKLKTLPDGVVMCVPVNWCEVVAYKSGHPVLWGGHGYGFERLQPTWPRMLTPIKEVVARHHVRYLLTMDGMLPDSFIADLPAAKTVTDEQYRLYCFGDAAGIIDEPSS